MINYGTSKRLLLAIVGYTLCASASHALDYTWTGAAGDSDWNNAANWDANGVPVDTVAGGSLDQQTDNDNIIIQGTAPTVNVPTFSGGDAFNRSNSNTPEIQMQLGTMTVNAGTWNGRGQVHNGLWSSSVGDGDTGNGLAVLNYNVTGGVSTADGQGGLNRDNGTLMDWTINADGTLNLDYTQGSSLRFAFSSNRTIGFNLAGGTLNIANALILSGYAGNFFDLTAAGASVTANFGSDFATITDVTTAIGNELHFISSNSLALLAVDNTDGTFTVSAVPETSAALLLGLFGVGLVLRRRR